MINLEVKGTLAKLLATEDLIVEHRNVETAQFNVDTRVLTLPNWEKATSEVIDLLISHEVGHALYTPNVNWTELADVPQTYINITEDARIEMLMKRKYGGLPKTFYRGYKELYEKDFFQIEGKDISEMNVADRVNIYFKLGNFLPVPFSPKEKEVVEQIAAAETFEEAVSAAVALHKIHEENKEDQEKVSNIDPEENGTEKTDSDSPDVEQDTENETDQEGDQESDGNSNEKQETQPDNSLDKSRGGQKADLDKIETVDNLEDSIKELVSNKSNDNAYVTHPSVDLESYVVPNKDIHEYIQSYWNHHKESLINMLSPEQAEMRIKYDLGIFEQEYQKFRRDIQSEVNYMVKEFECKKSADAYARASVSKTGVLDCTKLHTYKYNEDLFKKVTAIPEGKNHGLVFVLDWSGSMCDILFDTVKQLLSLVMFCDKVGIPFDVYSFTNEWRRNDSYEIDFLEDIEENTILIEQSFSMLNLLTSRVPRREVNEQMKTLFMMAMMYTKRSYGVVPDRLALSGTPLNEALLSLHKIIPDFKFRNNVQKVHSIVLTDGDACGMSYVKRLYQENGSKTRKFPARIQHVYLRNRKTGEVRSMPGYDATKVLIEDLRATFPETTFTAFRLLMPGNSYFVRQACDYDEKTLSEWKKNRMVSLPNLGYNRYFAIQANVLQQSTEFSVSEDASKAKIKSAFAKSLKGKKNNKKILGDFISLIA